MNKKINDLLIKIFDENATNSYVEMTRLTYSLKGNKSSSYKNVEDTLSIQLTEIAAKEFDNALEDAFAQIEKLHIMLKDNELIELKDRFIHLANDMMTTMNSVYNRDGMKDLIETVKLRFQVLGENLTIKINKKIEDYKFIRDNKRLTLSDRLAYWGIIACIVIGILTVIAGYYLAKYYL